MVTRSPLAALPFLSHRSWRFRRYLQDLRIDFLVGDIDDFARNLDLRNVLELELRDHFISDREFEIGLGCEDLVASASSSVIEISGCVADFSPRSVRISFGTNADDLVDEFGHDRLAIHLLELCERHLARTETVDPDAVLHTLKALIHLSFHVLGRDDDLDFALQPFSERFDYLHVKTFISKRRACIFCLIDREARCRNLDLPEWLLCKFRALWQAKWRITRAKASRSPANLPLYLYMVAVEGLEPPTPYSGGT